MTNTNINEIDDRKISGLIRSVRFRIPDRLDETVTREIRTRVEKEPTHFRPIRSLPRSFPFLPLWARVSLTAAAVCLLAIGIYIFHTSFKNEPDFIPEQGQTISEIKTEFEISNKNIKILWVQKQDFELRRHEQ